MDGETSGKKEPQIQGIWAPQTPSKPIKSGPMPIFPDTPGNPFQQFQPCSIPSGSTQATQAPGSVGIFYSDSSAVVDGMLISASGNDVSSKNVTWGNPDFDVTNSQVTKFQSLLDLANAASSVCAAAGQGIANNLYNLVSDTQDNGKNGEATNPNQLFEFYCNSYEPSQGMHGNYTPQMHQYRFAAPHSHNYDLNLPPGTTEEAIFQKNCSEFAPVTPSKDIGAENRDESDQQSSPTDAIIKENQTQDNHKQIPVLLEDSPSAIISTPLKENHNSDKGGTHGIDIGSTPQQKARRKRHRPKVASEEGKPSRSQKPITPNANASKDSSKPKRKYVRKKDVNRTSALEANVETINSKVRSRKKSSRRALSFDNTGQPNDGDANLSSKSTEQLEQEMGVKLTTQAGSAHNLECCLNQKLKEYIRLAECQDANLATAATSQGNLSVDTPRTRAEDRRQLPSHCLQINIMESMSSPHTSNCSTSAVLIEEVKISKRKHGGIKRKDGSTSQTGASYNRAQADGTVMHFPNICKKRRTEKVQYCASGSSSSMTGIRNTTEFSTISYQDDATANLTSYVCLKNFAPQIQPGKTSAMPEDPESLHKGQSIQDIQARSQSKRKRLKGQPRTSNTKLKNRVAEHSTQVVPPREMLAGEKGGRTNSLRPDACIEALAAETAPLCRKKRTKKRTSIVHSKSSETSKSGAQMVIYNPNQPFANPSGGFSEDNWQQMIIEKLKNLDINSERRQIPHEEQKALVLYKRDGTMILFDNSFDPTKKRRPRPKVDLDEETNRVWRLLLQDINSQGIDGTDEEKKKWWEGEREVFRGRADSFIARMRLVQGNRYFSPWKGSVVDSVVGVFLTQNVSDHLSSSAFMSLAARFPRKSKINQNSCSDVSTSIVLDTPDACMCGTEDTIKWNENMLNQVVCSNHSCMTVYEEKEGVYETSGNISHSNSPTNELKSRDINSPAYGQETYQQLNSLQSTTTATECLTGDRRISDDTDSSQNSLASSQNSADPSRDAAAERIGSHSESNSEPHYTANRFNFDIMTSPTSFVKLLQMQTLNMPHEVHIHECTYASPKNGINEEETLNLDKFDPLGNYPSMFRFSSSNHKLHLSPNPGALEVQSPYMSTEENGETAKSASQTSVQAMQRVTVSEEQEVARGNRYESIFWSENEHVQGSKIVAEPPSHGQRDELQQPEILPKLSFSTLAQRASELDQPSQMEQKTEESNMTEQSYTTASTSKPSNKRAAKNKKEEIEWDNLRREVEACGKKREKTENTMDSLDWEAVRCADVKEIADTIKERGMNNMLAERIKDFLNRVVRDHGGIDLEWLRDIQPDKAKEYLLSIRGLGLKSVECVRLLTLHHLAFPVDTNVGRIAVRLGWVPLQPLPESLQLHLLELYPVLESIQKYLWPRLCKLDQRTLYELHYQLITFGKVFCTKSKPNCNACPMRGECRHFASAFASSRLALPGPEEKSIVNAAETGTTHQNPIVAINHVPLPLLQTHESKETHQLGEILTVDNNEPIIEEPATPEPECMQTLEIDIEDAICEDPNDIPTIKLNIGELTQNLQSYVQHMEKQGGEVSKALVALTPEAASIPVPKLKNVSRLRTEHQVYELPDSHPLIEELDKREPDDPCSYLLAIWTPGETAESIQPPNKMCNSQGLNKLCDDQTCSSCNSIRETNSQTVRGTILIPCRTAMRGSFPLNGTYFQVNEVFADHESSLRPINVPRAWLWNLERRTVYFGTSIPSIFKGLSTADIQHCFWKGYVCVRGFDRETRAPRPLIARLHFPASKLPKAKDKRDDKELPSGDNI